ncbi:MAG: hypothetical protein Q7U03_10855 [Syntrophales bacterium]|nr:hypothetical protein [Syntrophales bacterium]
MEWLCQFFERKETWAIMGVILGFGLGELSRIIREWKRRRKLKKALLDELKMNDHLINQKKDNLGQIIEALKNKHILRAESVHAATTVYDTFFPEIIECLEPLYRDNIHIIYGHLKVNDSLMDGFYSSIVRDIQQGILKDPWKSYRNQIEDMTNSYSTAQSLIKAYLANKPQDVLYRHSER